mmetsp:Transcript_7745/g.9322  ORF Transcript_7745/g.9322 Transcript_7745/m.9322 type:complete len:105 (+) Transcript_7745:480-794(+)
MILLFCNLGCVIMGRIKAFWRLLSAYIGFALFLVHVGLLVSGAIYRFRPQGALCALNMSATDAPTTDRDGMSDTWTYEKDGSFILAVWIIQLMGAPICCLLASY